MTGGRREEGRNIGRKKDGREEGKGKEFKLRLYRKEINARSSDWLG